MPDQPAPAFLDVGGDRRIVVRFRPPERAGAATILFLPGYASDMGGAKALAIDAFAAATGCGCLRLDYSGTGESGGEFATGTLARWLEEVLAAIDSLVPARAVLAGSSMGGWLMLHAALRRPDRVQALLGIAAAPDFTDWGFSGEEKMSLLQNGRLERPNPYGAEASVTHRAFWQSAEALRLLAAPIAVTCPVRLVHGEQDGEVPIGVPLKLMAQLRSADVQLVVVKGGGHRLSEPREIDAILRALAPLVEIDE